jgi:hypothetical protein
VAEVRTRLTLGPGAVLHWLPQELILFEGAALDRGLEVEMAEDATLVMLETLVLGRAAMGETVSRLHLRDRRRVMRGGRPALIEGVRLGDADLARDGAAGLCGARAVASLSLIAATRPTGSLPSGRPAHRGPGARRGLGLGGAADGPLHPPRPGRSAARWRARCRRSPACPCRASGRSDHDGRPRT